MFKKIKNAVKLGIGCGILLSLASCTTTHVSSPHATTSPVYEPVSSTNFAKTGNFARSGAYHVVAPGETLWRIGQMYEVDIETIKKVNRIRDVRKVEIGEKLYIPGAAPRRDVITVYPNNKWKYIVVHHSATDKGNSMQFNAHHLRRGWKGVGYHFIIDNGTYGKDDGQIETGPRWLKQQSGAHCKANDMNERGIGICLVGNFSKRRPTRKQMDSLVYLVDELRSYYKIPKSRILGHGQVRGARTECPGTKFPWRTFKSRLR